MTNIINVATKMAATDFRFWTSFIGNRARSYAASNDAGLVKFGIHIICVIHVTAAHHYAI